MIFEFSGVTDWLSEVGAGITQITKIEPVTYNGKELAKIEFATARGNGSGLYRNDTPPLTQICRACGFPARAGDRLDSQQLIGRKFWGVWGVRIGARDGYTYADLAAAHPIPADAVEWRSLTDAEWAAIGRAPDGVKLSEKQKTAENKPVTQAPKEDDDFPF